MRRLPSPVRVAFATWLAVASSAVLLAWVNRPFTLDLRSLDSSDLPYVVASAVYTLAFALVGTVVATRTRNPVGWLLIAVAFGWMSPLLFEQYSLRAIALAPGSLPAGPWVVWSAGWMFALVVPALVLVFLLFPSGAARSRRWRPLVFAAPLCGLLLSVSIAFTPGDMVGGEQGNFPKGITVDNPVGLPGAEALLAVLTQIGAVIAVVLFLAGVVSMVLRFRSSHGIERQQIKWLVFVALGAVLLVATYSAIGRAVTDPALNDAIDSIGWGVLVTLVMLGTPLAIGAAILRYRLFDIDRMISRTLAYVLVTGVLVGAYALLVVGLGDVARSLTGSGDLAVAASTLAVAALFRPVLRSVRTRVDHRFNRRRYDAARTIEAFSARLREEVDIDALGDELSAVVRDTMHPAHVSLWVRGGR